MRIARRLQPPVCIKTHALSKWASRHLRGVGHEKRVAAAASTLFDLTAHLHELDEDDHRLLRMAAMVHDVGRAIDESTHHLEGARMIRSAENLPLTGRERRLLAYLTRYHKGRVPPAGQDNILRRRDDHRRLRLLLALLRAADTLDSRSAETPQLRFSLEGRRLKIHCHLEQNSAKARRVYTRRKKFRLLEELLGCRVEVQLSTSRSRLVA